MREPISCCSARSSAQGLSHVPSTSKRGNCYMNRTTRLLPQGAGDGMQASCCMLQDSYACSSLLLVLLNGPSKHLRVTRSYQTLHPPACTACVPLCPPGFLHCFLSLRLLSARGPARACVSVRACTCMFGRAFAWTSWYASDVSFYPLRFS